MPVERFLRKGTTNESYKDETGLKTQIRPIHEEILFQDQFADNLRRILVIIYKTSCLDFT